MAVESHCVCNLVVLRCVGFTVANNTTTKLAETEGSTSTWTVESLKKSLHEYVFVQENAQRHLSTSTHLTGRSSASVNPQGNVTSAEALTTTQV